MSAPLNLEVERYTYPEQPSHHVLASEASQSWSAYLASWTTSFGSSSKRRPLSRSSSLLSLKGRKGLQSSRAGSLERQSDQHVDNDRSFRNPWPSWHKPSSAEVWKAFEWGEDRDPCIDIARARLANEKASDSNDAPKTIQDQAAQLLHLEQPDFKFNVGNEKVKVTWLGHAGMLVQLFPLQKDQRPVRCLFDPIFSMRCSPNQNFGPVRSYPPPCKIEDLPEVDVFMMSHNHYDHLDYDSVLEIWKRNMGTIQFIVPLGNRQWFLDCGIDAERVVELDWWDAATLQPPSGDALPLKITCTPAQHNSGRSGPADADTTLWSSWYIEHGLPSGMTHRVYFAGDTGYQFHDSPSWPPAPPSDSTDPSSAMSSKRHFGFRRKQNPGEIDRNEDKQWPECPAFKDIASRLGQPHVLMLPVSVGATYDYLRSFSGLPDSWNVIPRHNPGVTAHNHMPPWDAVRVFRTMTDNEEDLQGSAPVAIAMHWGTFVTDPIEVLKTLGQLEWACEAHGLEFCRSLAEWQEAGAGKRRFIAVHHGESVAL
ncbi:N-acyl-phosphatidylethanolamine-hydrolyzing phospholipase D [Teratosphaeria destructans]|uniref:N-acyl-phosphatidylethanolamine-hydrolyzing phospholipase D n=1 Tax=Teratosphaeria destructans TaxID=418781 RepID=A0A9W7SZ92_9PEZI|nr:N-acyl-phosphatidylethanolamine-hydrolyzing phospholipase D [Teratosphaeria destructans]